MGGEGNDYDDNDNDNSRSPSGMTSEKGKCNSNCNGNCNCNSNCNGNSNGNCNCNCNCNCTGNCDGNGGSWLCASPTFARSGALRMGHPSYWLVDGADEEGHVVVLGGSGGEVVGGLHDAGQELLRGGRAGWL